MKRQVDNSTSEKLREIKDYDNPVAGVTVLSMDYLVGEVFRHSELLGLNERQLMAYKSSLREMVWKWYNSHFENPSGLVDISHQARVHHGIESLSTHSGSRTSYVTVTQ